MTPDVNVLVAAFRADHPHHTTSRVWLEQAVAAAGSGASFNVMPMVTASFLRLVTSPRIFQQPTPIDHAVAFIDALLAACVVQHGEHLVTFDRDFRKLLSRGQLTVLTPQR
jgi:predicted nucleic acid-binding protein